MGIVDGIQRKIRIFGYKRITIPRAEPTASAEFLQKIIYRADSSKLSVSIEVYIFSDALYAPFTDTGKRLVITGCTFSDDDFMSGRLIIKRYCRASDFMQKIA